MADFKVTYLRNYIDYESPNICPDKFYSVQLFYSKKVQIDKASFKVHYVVRSSTLNNLMYITITYDKSNVGTYVLFSCVKIQTISFISSLLLYTGGKAGSNVCVCGAPVVRRRSGQDDP